MAKRRKEPGEEEELDFKIPKFDEEKFLKKERRNMKTMFISFIFGIIMAFVCFGFWALMVDTPDWRWPLVFIIMFFYLSFIRYFYNRLNIDLTDFGKKGWFTSIATYFFTWLLVFVVLVNPPIYDDEAPIIDGVILPDMQEIGGTVDIVARVTDNAGIKSVELSIIYPDDNIDEFSDLTPVDDIYSYTFVNSNNILGEFTVILNVTDTSGFTTEWISSFEYSNNTIKLPEPEGSDEAPGPNIVYSTDIKIDVNANVSRVYYTVDDGPEINVVKVGEFYETNPSYIGWPTNKNVTVKVYAEVTHYFSIITTLPPNQWDQLEYPTYNNTITDSQTYYFQVGEDEIGTETPPEVTIPKPVPTNVPGFELIIFISALIAVVLIFKYKKKDKRR